MSLSFILPENWRRPPGISHGVSGTGRQMLLVGGQLGGMTGVDAPDEQADLAEQFAAALKNVTIVVRTAGGMPEDIAALRVFVTDIAAFKNAQPKIAETWRDLMGRHFPAMTLVEVRALFETTALVEIEATALIAEKETSCS